MRYIRHLAAMALLLAGFGVSAALLLGKISAYESGKAEYRLLRKTLSFAPEAPLGRNDGQEVKKWDSDGQDEAWTKQMVSRNPDYAFWLWVPGTEINYPVVRSQVPGYYLNHTFSGAENPCGTIFYEEGEEGVARDNLILYGHNMKDGTMFADLKLYMTEEFFQSHPDIWIYRQEEWLRYTVFSCRIVREGDESVYCSSFLGGDEKQEYIDKMKENSLYPAPIQPQITDSLMTLSTCFGKGKRVIVQAVLMCYTE